MTGVDFTEPAFSFTEHRRFYFRRQLAAAGPHVLAQLLEAGAAVPTGSAAAELAGSARELLYPELSAQQRRWLDGLTDDELLTSLTHHQTSNGGSI